MVGILQKVYLRRLVPHGLKILDCEEYIPPNDSSPSTPGVPIGTPKRLRMDSLHRNAAPLMGDNLRGLGQGIKVFFFPLCLTLSIDRYSLAHIAMSRLCSFNSAWSCSRASSPAISARSVAMAVSYLSPT